MLSYMDSRQSLIATHTLRLGWMNDRKSVMAQGVTTSMYERQLMAWVLLS